MQRRILTHILGFGLVLASILPRHSLEAQQRAVEDDVVVAPGPAENSEGEIGISGYELAENIKNRRVVNSIGKEVGEISNIIIHGDRVTHAIISIGGFVGLGGSEVVVPFGILSFSGEQVTIETLASADQIEELTLFEPEDFGLSE